MAKSPEPIINLQTTYQGSAVAGQWTIQATVQTYPCPVGIIWFSHSCRGELQINSIFVNEIFRRCGIASEMHKVLRQSYPKDTFITGHSTADGKRWLKSLGYQRCPDFGWELPPFNLGKSKVRR